MSRPYSNTSADFGERYFREDMGRPYARDAFWVNFYNGIADGVVAGIGPRRVLDAGCAMGFLVEALRARGVEAFGFDLSADARLHTPVSAQPYCWQASVTDEIAGTYDLIVCLEVLPHLLLQDAENVVGNFCRHTDDVLFSVYPYGPAPLHANIAPPEHWAGVFARHRFYRDFAFDATFATPYAVRYRRRQEPVETILREYEGRLRFLLSELNSDRAGRHYAEATIVNMQRSWFWRAREMWQRAKALAKPAFSRRRGETHS